MSSFVGFSDGTSPYHPQPRPACRRRRRRRSPSCPSPWRHPPSLPLLDGLPDQLSTWHTGRSRVQILDFHHASSFAICVSHFRMSASREHCPPPHLPVNDQGGSAHDAGAGDFLEIVHVDQIAARFSSAMTSRTSRSSCQHRAQPGPGSGRAFPAAPLPPQLPRGTS